MPFSIDSVLIIFSGVTFIVYGLLCLATDHMMLEFTRYGLEKFRTLTGFLELLGGLGSLIGFFYSRPVLLLSTLGLTLLMLLGIIVRLRIKDPIFLILPAFVLFVTNAIIFYRQL